MFNIICETVRKTATVGILPSYLATQPLSPEMRLAALGIASPGTMPLLSEIPGRLPAPLLDLDLAPTTTLGDIAAGLASASARASASAMTEPLPQAA